MDKAKEGLLVEWSAKVTLVLGLPYLVVNRALGDDSDSLTEFFSLFHGLGIGMVQLENSIKLKLLYSCVLSLGSTERVVVTVKWTLTSCLIKILARRIWNGI